MNYYKKVTDGYKFEVTDLGKTIPHVQSKFNQDSIAKVCRQYKVAVPLSWIEKGYVREVKIDDEA